jgi:hypothetical protein
MNGASEIYKVLVANATIQGLVSKTGTAPNIVYKIAASVVDPSGWGIADSTIAIYQSGTETASDVYDVNHTVNCRANTEKKAKELAQAVKAALHRVTFPNIGFVCFIEPVIPPQDDTDNFNAPVTVRVIGTK